MNNPDQVLQMKSAELEPGLTEQMVVNSTSTIQTQTFQSDRNKLHLMNQM